MDKPAKPEKFSLIHEQWVPKVLAALDRQEFKLLKVTGTAPWHRHDAEDEVFLVWKGRITVEFRDRRVELEAGEFCVVPSGVEHRTRADGEARILGFEPAQARLTGTVVDDSFAASDGLVI
jgi:mannose-6-phosphate isomerase-like protein (cupin superfamily)